MKYNLRLHLVVFIAGFSGIIGKAALLSSETLVLYRVLIASVLLFIVLKYKKIKIILDIKKNIFPLLIGFLVALHWLCFFLGIKKTNVSVALICLASIPLFVSFLEPVFYKKKLSIFEIALSIFAIFGIYLIQDVEPSFTNGIFISILSAFFSALFMVLNAKYFNNRNLIEITFWEMNGALIFMVLTILFGFSFIDTINSFFDLSMVLFLGIICTAYSFIEYIYLSKKLTTYKVAIVNNLEPIYSIILAIIFFSKTEVMSLKFYIGSLIIMFSVATEIYFKNYIPKTMKTRFIKK